MYARQCISIAFTDKGMTWRTCSGPRKCLKSCVNLLYVTKLKSCVNLLYVTKSSKNLMPSQILNWWAFFHSDHGTDHHAIDWEMYQRSSAAYTQDEVYWLYRRRHWQSGLLATFGMPVTHGRDQLPLDFSTTCLEILQTSSVPDFNNNIELSLRLGIIKSMGTEEIFIQAKKWYKKLLELQEWIVEKVHQSAFTVTKPNKSNIACF